MNNFRRKIGSILVGAVSAALILGGPSAGTSERVATSASTQIRLIDVLEVTNYRGGPALMVLDHSPRMESTEMS